jgi:hypothetical protein
MKFSIGDKVILKRTGEEGQVVAYINQQMLEVEVNGTAFPVYIDEVDHPYLKWFTEKKKPATNDNKFPEQLPVEKEKFRAPRLAKGVYLSFLPAFKPNEQEDIVDHIKIYLLNELPVAIRFGYEVKLLNNSLFRHDAQLHGFGHIYLHSIPFGDMNDQPRFHWKVSDPAQPAMRQEEGILRIRPQKLFEHISVMLRDNEPSFSYLLLQDFSPALKPQKPEKIEIVKPLVTPVPATEFPAKTEAPKYEIDLHIEILVDNTRGLTNADMLLIQLDTLKKYLHLAIMNRQERMMVIHGLGKGVLRDEVHRILSETPGVSRYVNEWQGQYGFGATEVFFDYL